MKKIMAAAAAVCMVLAACGNTGGTPAVTENITEQSTETVTETTKETSRLAVSTTETEVTTETSLTAVGTTEAEVTTETAAAGTPPAESQGAEIVMTIVSENYAWRAYQDVTVIDTSGAQYRYTPEDEEDFIRLGEGGTLDELGETGWYDYLYDVKQCEYVGNVSDKALEEILEFSGSFERYVDVPFDEYDGGLRDYGSRCLYGIYTGENGEPEYVRLCRYGDWAGCRDDFDATIFANNMIELDVLYTVSPWSFHIPAPLETNEQE